MVYQDDNYITAISMIIQLDNGYDIIVILFNKGVNK